MINLDDVYEWLGFTRKDNAKSVVRKKLEEGLHYIVSLLSSQERTRGGQNKEQVMMTVHGFKQLCMQAGTAKAQRVREVPSAPSSGGA